MARPALCSLLFCTFLLLLPVSLGQLPLPVPVSPSPVRECTEAEQRTVRDNQKQCASQVDQRYSTGRMTSVDLCNRVDEKINKCSEHTRPCLSDEDHRLYKDVQIESLIKVMNHQKLGQLFDRCRIVQEYRRSGRKPYRATSKCNLERVGELVKSRDQCVAEQYSAMEKKIRNLFVRTRAAVTALICEYIEQSLKICMPKMRECLSETEYKQELSASYTELTEVLRSLNSKFDLAACNNVAVVAGLTLAGGDGDGVDDGLGGGAGGRRADAGLIWLLLLLGPAYYYSLSSSRLAMV